MKLAEFNKPLKLVPAAKGAASTGLATRCFARRLAGRYTLNLIYQNFHRTVKGNHATHKKTKAH